MNQPTELRCPACGAKIKSSNFSFCPSCGCNLGINPAKQNGPNSVQIADTRQMSASPPDLLTAITSSYKSLGEQRQFRKERQVPLLTDGTSVEEFLEMYSIYQSQRQTEPYLYKFEEDHIRQVEYLKDYIEKKEQKILKKGYDIYDYRRNTYLTWVRYRSTRTRTDKNGEEYEDVSYSYGWELQYRGQVKAYKDKAVDSLTKRNNRKVAIGLLIFFSIFIGLFIIYPIVGGLYG